jgi:hypothetical protein
VIEMFSGRKRRKRALLAKMALGLVVVAAFAPAAHALRPDDRAIGPRTEVGAASHYTDQALNALGQRWQAEARFYLGRSSTSSYPRPDDRATGPRTEVGLASHSTDSSYPRPDDRAGIRGVDESTVATSGNGFDWRDAGIGAAVAMAALLLLGYSRYRFVAARKRSSGKVVLSS